MERCLRTLVLITAVALNGCSGEPGDCLLHSQCSARQQCLDGRCTVPIDAGLPEAGPDAATPDAIVEDVGLMDAQATDAEPQSVDSGGLSDATRLDTAPMDSSVLDATNPQRDGALVIGDATHDHADVVQPMVDGGWRSD